MIKLIFVEDSFLYPCCYTNMQGVFFLKPPYSPPFSITKPVDQYSPSTARLANVVLATSMLSHYTRPPTPPYQCGWTTLGPISARKTRLKHDDDFSLF